MREGKLPHFQRLMERGDFKKLRTSIPPESPVAWSNFITGLNPGGHAIFDFIHRDPATMTPYFSAAKAEAPSRQVRLGEWVIPLSSGEVRLLRQGPAFWELPSREGVPCTILRIPSNYPPVPCPARQLAGMGTPDLLGTYGTFTFFTTDRVEKYAGLTGGEAVQLHLENQQARGVLKGPFNTFRRESPSALLPFTIFVDPQNPVIRMDLADQHLLIKEKEWSPWIRIRFEIVPWLSHLRGICRFYLKEVRPHLKLYVSPLNLDPLEPALPLSTPDSYSAQLAGQFGLFSTLGIPQDTNALSAGVLNDEEFLALARSLWEEENRLFERELERFRSGILFAYFGSVDAIQHMFWRCRDPLHPARSTCETAGDPIAEFYQKMDRVVGRTMDSIDENTILLVMSDHGFAPFHRAFHLTTWLKNNGYVSLTDFSEGELLKNVDWTNTRAYAMGFNALYLNLKGREMGGIVGAEKEGLLTELERRLLDISDPKTGEKIISRVYRTSRVYSGPYAGQAPDLIIGYQRGYRASWETALGKFPRGELIRDNLEKWSGDHLIDAALVPGVILSNRKLANPDPALTDLAPAILRAIGRDPLPGMGAGDLFR